MKARMSTTDAESTKNILPANPCKSSAALCAMLGVCAASPSVFVCAVDRTTGGTIQTTTRRIWYSLCVWQQSDGFLQYGPTTVFTATAKHLFFGIGCYQLCP
eukprot:194806-Rhodomonas_salina.2